MPLRTRFAPTPSGYVHVGNAWSFLLTWLSARSQGGAIHLRIDDMDSVRHREHFVEDIFASLQWLGLDWDTGPRNPSELASKFSQQLKLKNYLAALETASVQSHLFACTCSREAVRRASASGRYPGTCHSNPVGAQIQDVAWRFHLENKKVRALNETWQPIEFDPFLEMGDFIVRQKNGEPSYHLVSVLDDERLGINFVVRGADLAPSTGAQLALAQVLGCTQFLSARFWHHDLVLNATGEKLSKSEGAESLLAMRNRFSSAAPLIGYFAKHMGIFEKVNTPKDLLPFFKLGGVPNVPIAFEAMRDSL